VDERERTLIAECLAGRVDAFGELVRPHQDRLFNTLYRLCGHREEAADALQDGLVRAYRRLASFQGDAAFFTWLYRVVVNTALSRRRRERAGRMASAEHAHELADDALRTAPDRRLAQADVQRLVAAALAEVDDAFRAVLVMKEIDGLRYEEIAAVLKVPVGTVRSRLHRGRAELRAKLQPLLEAGAL
jgi:RNA polymerase sigma-70 factor, ECF subfamily